MPMVGFLTRNDSDILRAKTGPYRRVGYQTNIPPTPLKDSGKKKDGKVDLLLAHEHAAVTDPIHSFPSKWVVDFGASSHIYMNHDWFTSYSLLNPPCPILLGDKCVLHAIGQGQIEIVIHNDPDDHCAIIKDVLVMVRLVRLIRTPPTISDHL